MLQAVLKKHQSQDNIDLLPHAKCLHRAGKVWLKHGAASNAEALNGYVQNYGSLMYIPQKVKVLTSQKKVRLVESSILEPHGTPTYPLLPFNPKLETET